ncbi:hypothetical protein RRG08_030479 [Elysia crispata]|uniref:Uncharacterized protein n=1 Tax=Elysia crispata TaxID=231223 RepID=A0AAE1B0U1_9GAST|nr:hypothetical protein RRG08_030479 [Elysia crispata]
MLPDAADFAISGAPRSSGKDKREDLAGKALSCLYNINCGEGGQEFLSRNSREQIRRLQADTPESISFAVTGDSPTLLSESR